MTVDRSARLELANSIERYLNGEIDNFALDDAMGYSDTKDIACIEIRSEMRRFLDDFNRHRYVERMLLPVYEDGVRRWISFLRSDSPWPFEMSRAQIARSSPLQFIKALWSVFDRYEKTEFTNPYWPYKNASEWEEILQQERKRVP